MKTTKLRSGLKWLTFVCIMLMMAAEAFASENGNNWRPTYDLIMLWVNFLIFGFIIYKYGRKPLANFLRSQQDEIGEKLGRLEAERTKIQAEIEQTRKSLEECEGLFQDIKEKIVREGERKKQEIIDKAQTECAYMMEAAKLKIGNKIMRAKERFKTELVDAAVDLALERIPQLITDEDNEKMLNLFFNAVESRQV